jgi:chromosome partitioning protein
LEEKLPRIILCTHNNGGVGKTTLAIHIAGILTTQPGKTLLIDCDDQADSWQFYAGRVPEEYEFKKIDNRLSILENRNRKRVKDNADLEEYDNIILDIDSPLHNTVQTIVQNNPEFVFIPINASQKDKAFRNLYRPLSTISTLEKKSGYSPKVIIVPLGIKHDTVIKEFDKIVDKPQNGCVAPAMRNIPGFMSKAVYKKRQYVWDLNKKCQDIKDYFDSLLDNYM